MSTDRLLTLPEAAELLHIGRTKMYDLLDRGEIGSVYIGRRRFIPESEVGHFIEWLKAVHEPTYTLKG